MRRLIVLLAISAGLGAFGVMACGGNDKPPLTPDGTEQTPPTDLTEAGAPPATSAAPASTEAPPQ
jgi:hypothetical protein